MFTLLISFRCHFKIAICIFSDITNALQIKVIWIWMFYNATVEKLQCIINNAIYLVWQNYSRRSFNVQLFNFLIKALFNTRNGFIDCKLLDCCTNSLLDIFALRIAQLGFIQEVFYYLNDLIKLMLPQLIYTLQVLNKHIRSILIDQLCIMNWKPVFQFFVNSERSISCLTYVTDCAVIRRIKIAKHNTNMLITGKPRIKFY